MFGKKKDDEDVVASIKSLSATFPEYKAQIVDMIADGKNPTEISTAIKEMIDINTANKIKSLTDQLAAKDINIKELNDKLAASDINIKSLTEKVNAFACFKDNVTTIADAGTIAADVTKLTPKQKWDANPEMRANFVNNFSYYIEHLLLKNEISDIEATELRNTFCVATVANKD
jgi:uncharacterized coiled-coil protein SlyX